MLVPAPVRPVVRVLAFAAVAVLGLFQAFWHLGRANINPDEGVYLTAGQQYVRGVFTFNREHPPTAKYLFGVVQEILGQDLTSGRIAATTIAFLAGVVLFAWLRRELGFWWALLATGFWWLLPRAVVQTGIKIDRFAILEPFMVSFAILALALGWWWFRRPQWWAAALAGAAMALSVTSKVSTAFLVVTFAYLVVRVLIRDRAVRAALVGLASYIVAFAAVFVASWHPMGMISAIRYMLAFQSEQNRLGHNVIVAGRVVLHPPWWANLWFTEQGLGPWLLAALCLAALFAFLPRPSELSVYLGVALAVLLVFYLLVAKNALPSYYYVWVWILFVLAVIGTRNLFEIRRRRRRILRPLALVVLLVAATTAVTTTVAIARVGPTGFARVGPVLAEHGVTRIKILSTGYASWEFKPYLGANVKPATIDASNHASFGGAPFTATVVALRTDNRIHIDRPLETFVESQPARFTRVVVDDVDLYLPKGGRTVVQTGDSFAFGPPAA